MWFAAELARSLQATSISCRIAHPSWYHGSRSATGLACILMLRNATFAVVPTVILAEDVSVAVAPLLCRVMSYLHLHTKCLPWRIVQLNTMASFYMAVSRLVSPSTLIWCCAAARPGHPVPFSDDDMVFVQDGGCSFVLQIQYVQGIRIRGE